MWPGSHYTAHKLMRHPDGKVRRRLTASAKERRRQRRAADAIGVLGESDRQGGYWSSAGDEEEEEFGYESDDGPLPDLGPHQKLRLRAGDVVLAHSELAHCGGPNLACDIRYMLYYRVRHRDWATMVEEKALVEDMWCDLEGTWGVLGRRGS